MVNDLPACTLYDDWKARRKRLAGASGELVGYQTIEMKLLDYLLVRYQASTEVARPARFPVPMTLFVNHRSIAVHHHLFRGLPAITERAGSRLLHSSHGRTHLVSPRNECESGPG